MSSVTEQDHLNPKDPLYYAPRWLREKRDAAPASPPEAIDTQLEKAVSNALRHPLDPQVIEEPEALTQELRRMAILGVAGRFAAAVGVSALVALFFVVMIPASRSPDGLIHTARPGPDGIGHSPPSAVRSPACRPVFRTLATSRHAPGTVRPDTGGP